jgi:hypothetical protein
MSWTAFRLAILCFVAMSFAQFASSQQAANVAGKWDVTVRMPDRTVNEQWTIQQENAKITGTVKGEAGEQPMKGEISEVNFRADVGTGEKQYKVLATIDNDTMDGAVRMGKNEYLWSAKRSKSR